MILLLLQNILINDVSNIFVSLIEQLWNINGYSIDKYSEDVNIKATNQILHILNEFNINLKEEKSSSYIRLL